MSDISVRAADAEADAAACAEIYRHYVEYSTSTFEYEAPSAAEMSLRIGSALATHEWLVATNPGEREEIVGFSYASAWNPRPAYDFSCETTVYVRSGEAGRGIGRALYDELLRRLRTRQFRRALGRIALPNEASIRLHESFGYTPVGVHHELGYKHGEWIDVLHMELALGSAVTT